MKRTVLFSAVTITLGAFPTAWAADVPVPAAPPAPAPKIEFASPILNFGKVKSGDTVKQDFIFTNAGTATLEITEVRPGCGCTTAGTWDKKVEPGKTGIIPLQFNSTGFGGQVSKSATITCNDPVRSNLVVQISGTVWKPIDVTPQMAMFNVVSEAPTNETKILKIVSNLEEPVTLSDLKCNNASFQAELKETKPGKEFDLLVTAVPPFTNATVFSTITFKTSSTNAPLLSVSAYAIIQQPVTVSPQQVMLPAGPLKSAFTSAVLVRNNSTNSLELSDVRLDAAGVELKVTQPQTGRIYSVNMTFPAGFELQANQKLELAMKSSHPKFAEIKVPVTQMKAMAALPAADPGRAGSPLPAGVSSSVSPGPSPLRTASPTTPLSHPPTPITTSPVKGN